MKPNLALVSPRTALPLELTVFETKGEEIIEGLLTEPDGYWYPITAGVPRLLVGNVRPDTSAFEAAHKLDPVPDQAAPATGQEVTNETFSDKWRRFRNYGLEEGHLEFLLGWYQKKFGLADLDALNAFYAKRKRILEIGPGSGFHSKYMAEHSDAEVYAVDISEAADTVYENAGHLPNVHVINADLLALPLAPSDFDLVVADGVLHHTPSTSKSVEALLKMVRPGGQFFFYVYRRMGALREFADDHIRASFTQLEPEACYKACEGITDLGRELSRLDAKVTLEKPIDILGIPAGTHDVQRLLYYSVLKCFWNEAFDYETNNMVNFDWYHPHHAWRHTEEEVKGWLEELGVTEYSFQPANPNGISTLLTRPGA